MIQPVALWTQISTGKRIVFAMDRREVCHMYPVFRNSRDTIRNTYADTPDVDVMVAYNHDRVRKFAAQSQTHSNAQHRLYKLSWTLTPNFQSVFMDTIRPGKHPHSLFDLASTANSRLGQFVADIRDEYGFDHSTHGVFIPANIMICDYWNLNSNVVANAIAFNFPLIKNS